MYQRDGEKKSEKLSRTDIFLRFDSDSGGYIVCDEDESEVKFSVLKFDNLVH